MNADLETIRDSVKTTVTMAEVLRMLGLPEPNRQKKIRSIFNQAEKTPSLHVYEYDWFDYSTGQGGDQIAFVQQVLGCNYMQALQILGRGAPLATRRRNSHDMPWEPPDMTDQYLNEPAADETLWDQWETLVATKWPYLNMLDLVDFRCKVVGSGDLWVPHWIYNPDDGKSYVRGIKVRHLPDADKSSVKGSSYIVGLYRPRPRKPDHTHAVLVEGESDAWVLAKMLETRDATVLALPSGAGTRKPRFLEEMRAFKSVGVALDQDGPGQEAARWVYDNLETAYPVDVPGGRVAEAAADGWTL